MPISEIDGRLKSHWDDVRAIFEEAVVAAGYKPRLVSFADETRVIQKTIIENLYNDEIIVVDVSAKNPNVMFELGLRLAFNRPAVVVKDDDTEYSFDTSSIEHLGYRRDLRYQDTIKFRDDLQKKILATATAKDEDGQPRTFLNELGPFKTFRPTTKEVGAEEYLLEQFAMLRDEVRRQGYRRGPRHVADVVPPLVRRQWLRDRCREVLPKLGLPTESLADMREEIGDYLIAKHDIQDVYSSRREFASDLSDVLDAMCPDDSD